MFGVFDGILALVYYKYGQVYFQHGVSDKVTKAAIQLFILSDFKHIGK